MGFFDSLAIGVMEGVPPKCIVEAVLECGSSRWYAIGIKIYNDDKVTTLTADKPACVDKLQAILQRRQREVGERQLAEDLLKACNSIKDPIYFEVIKEAEKLSAVVQVLGSIAHAVYMLVLLSIQSFLQQSLNHCKTQWSD